MPIQNNKFDKTEFINKFVGAFSQINGAKQLGKDFAGEKMNRIIFVGCGAPHYMMRILAYWGQKCSIATNIQVYHPTELISHDPLAIDEKTLIILCSHSGTTKETLDAAKFLQTKPCKTLAITQEESSPLGMTVQSTLPYGITTQGYFSSYILAQTLFSAFLNDREDGWGFHSALMKSLPNLPAALADAKVANFFNAAMQAKELAVQNLIFVLGAGPMYTTAYVFAGCFLMEMQWMHAHALTISDFFHGPFEVVDKTKPLIVLIGEDSSRSEGDRVKRFSSQYAGSTFVYDSREFDMQGIHPEIRPIIAPFILDSALTCLVEELAVLRDHPMTTRRYMGKVQY